MYRIRFPKAFLMALLRLYRRYISPLFPPTCRYHPTCSTYAMVILRFAPLWYALPLIFWRLCRCNQMFKGGYDYPCVWVCLKREEMVFLPISITFWVIPKNNSYTFNLFYHKIEFQAYIITNQG
ncbi:membrane protein insertion efficiency factor YidD [Helicobacter enhydrae]|uniref:Putative membrane protein insertion efficiency factor n=1 Tax=Helicobacter enhydrae TaxID=222136 RepID=A0A1B1U4E9_9HELI|nr:membrane protein insertion efficiency factor YidD [Helicobacter enhydrae]ANV97626.1 membrane protein insertion efficiency factor YidD [Helicobacter enhydrae]